jgi:predicted dehydrogenase
MTQEHSEKADNLLRVGVVGCGVIGRRRAQFVQVAPQERVVMVADPQIERARAVAQENNALATADWQEVVARSDIDVVVVATPNKYLTPIVVAALNAGKHVLCEKPPGRNATETAQMVAAARQNDRILKVGFNHRYHPAIWRAHELVKQGIIGPLLYIRAIYGHGGRPGYDTEWRSNADLSGGGELLDQGVHIVDLCRLFLGEFKSVFCSVETFFWNLGHFDSGKQLEDNAFALLKTPAGQIAQFHTSWTQWRNRFSFELFGRDGYLLVEGLGGSYGTETLTIGRRQPESGPPTQETHEFPGSDISWQAEWQDFTSAIRNGNLPLAHGEDGLQTMRVLAALYESAHSGLQVTL